MDSGIKKTHMKNIILIIKIITEIANTTGHNTNIIKNENYFFYN